MEIFGSIIVGLVFAAAIVFMFLAIRSQEKANQRIVSYWKAISVSLQEIAVKEDK